jgi:hypothetical protein
MDQSSVLQHFVSQYRASLAMLRTAIEVCPESLWLASDCRNRFWHVAYHSIFYTHLYVQAGEAEFRPWHKHQPDSQYLGPRPWAPNEAVVIERPYSQEEVLEYHDFCCAEVISKAPAFGLEEDSGFSWLPFNKTELHLYNIRHIQHHTGQLIDRLRTSANIAVPWVRMG